MITFAELIKGITPLAAVQASTSTLQQAVTAVTSDSRKVIPGSLFVAIQGEKADGHAYIPEAIRRGCLAVVLDKKEGLGELTVPTILVRDGHEAISELAATWYGHPAEQLQQTDHQLEQPDNSARANQAKFQKQSIVLPLNGDTDKIATPSSSSQSEN